MDTSLIYFWGTLHGCTSGIHFLVYFWLKSGRRPSPVLALLRKKLLSWKISADLLKRRTNQSNEATPNFVLSFFPFFVPTYLKMLFQNLFREKVCTLLGNSSARSSTALFLFHSWVSPFSRNHDPLASTKKFDFRIMLQKCRDFSKAKSSSSTSTPKVDCNNETRVTELKCLQFD